MDGTADPIRVLLLDDHEIVARGLADLLRTEPDLDVVATATTATEAIQLARSVQPDVAVLDIRLEEGNGIDVCRRIRDDHPHIACLMLTSFEDDEALVEAADAGAAGFVLKQVRGNALVESIRKVATGAMLLDEAAVRRARQRREDATGIPLASLTDRERRIFDLIGDGYTNRQIADELHLAEKTIKNYTSNLLAKLGLQRRTEVAAHAARLAERHRRRFD